MTQPFESKGQAAYWGGGVLAEDINGGWWSLHALTNPNGVDFSSVGADGGQEGWPHTLKFRHFFGSPADGGRSRICYDPDETTSEASYRLAKKNGFAGDYREWIKEDNRQKYLEVCA